MNWSILKAILFALILGGSSATAVAQTTRNIDILTAWIDSSITELLASDVVAGREEVGLAVTAQDSLFGEFVSRVAREVLIRAGMRVVVRKNNGKQNAFLPVIHIVFYDWQVTYRQKKRGIFRKSVILRNLRADYYVEVLSFNAERVLYSRRMRPETEDLLPSDDGLEVAETPSLPFTRGKMRMEKGFLRKWAEPVFLFAISGTILYLFYSVRSK